MPKVYTHKARKDYPESGIKKGDIYYEWALYRQKSQRSLTNPTRAQTAGSPWKQQLYNLIDVELPACSCPEDLRSIAESARELSSEAQESFDSMNEGLQQSEGGQRMETRVSEMDSWAYEVDSAAEELEGAIDETHEYGEKTLDWDIESDTYTDAHRDALTTAIEECESSAPDVE
jgi:hypothetical protein